MVDCAALLLRQRFVKSTAEIEKIRHACAITSDAFEALPRSVRYSEFIRASSAYARACQTASG